MNVLMFLMTEFKHDARVTKEARSLTDAGHQVRVSAILDKETQEIEKRDNFIIERVNLRLRYTLPKGNIFFFIKYIEYIYRVFQQYKKQEIDIYHAHDLETLPVAYLLSKANKKPLIYDSHELYIDQARHGKMRRWVWYHIEKFLAPKTFETFMETESRGKIYAERYKVKQPTTLMNCQYFNFIESSNKFREILPISQDEKIILYQGGIEKDRGCDILLDAMHHLDNRVLVFLGNGVYKETLREKAEQHPKCDNIFVLDAVPWEELYQYTASADIGAFPLQNVSLQYYYALSNKLFEFLSAGLPVVFSDFPEMRKVIVDHNVGFVVDETQPQQVAEAIDKILDDTELYQKMSANAKRIIKEKYNWEIEVSKLLDTYKRIENI